MGLLSHHKIDSIDNRRLVSPSFDSVTDDYGRTKEILDFTVLDIETTGVSKVSDYVLSISAVRYRKGKPVATFNQFLNPYDHYIPIWATRVNHITDEDVKNKPYLDQVIPTFMVFIGHDVLMGYNINRFDNGCFLAADG